MTHSTSTAQGRCARTTAVALAAAAAMLAAAHDAQALVSAPGADSVGDQMANITYGNGGNIYQLEPMLFMLGLGNASDPAAVAGRNAALQYSFAVSGQDTNLMTIDYRVRNTSASDSFSQLRFLVFANPDGAGDLADVLGQSWGPAAAGDADLREGRAVVDPITGIKADFRVNGTLANTAFPQEPTCAAAPGCDATLGLQWNATTLAPGETFHLRLGLSDNGTTLSGRFLTATSVSNPATVLTVSGHGAIVPVPEPGAAWMLAAGLAGLVLLRRRHAG